MITVANLWQRYRRPHAGATGLKGAALDPLRAGGGCDERRGSRDVSAAAEAWEPSLAEAKAADARQS